MKNPRAPHSGKRFKKRLKSALQVLGGVVLVGFLGAGAHLALAQGPLSITVNSIGDAGDASTADNVCETATAGECTLRAAIEQANANANSSISFNISGAGVRTIAPQSQLPTITAPGTIIDGYTQPNSSANTLALGNDAVLLIELNGASAGTVGLFITGGTSTVRGLVINRSPGSGILLSGNGGNTIEGCFLGTDAGGTVDLGNAGNGIQIASSPSNIIGASAAASRNVISGNNNSGISLEQAATTGTIVQGNSIGTDKDGTGALGNLFDGISIGGAQNSVIGGVGVGQGNIIANNASNAGGVSGVSVASTSSGNSIRGNSIFDNKGPGIDLSSVALGANDTGDADGGSNLGQNSPELTLVSADASAGTTNISGNFASTPNRTFLLDFYSNATRDASGFGEGETFLGSSTLALDGNGSASFGVQFTPAVAAGRFITATATDPGGNTSEFSNALQVLAPRDIVTSTSDSNVVGSGSLRDAINFANQNPGTTISFAIPGVGAHIISPTTTLPSITAANTSIDGYTQPGASENTLATIFEGTDAQLQIVLSGASLSTNSLGLGLKGGGATIRGLVLNGFGPGTRGALIVESSGNIIEGCFVGTNAAGDAAASVANERGVFVRGLAGSRADNNVIGGATPASRNLISGNGIGVNILSDPSLNPQRASGNTVSNSLIGTDRSGLAAIPNDLGVQLDGTSANTIGGVGAGNIISGNSGVGLLLSRRAQDNDVASNLIGLAANLASILGNGQSGVRLEGDVQNNSIGGGGTSPQNSANNIQYNNTSGTAGGGGVEILQPAGAMASGNSIRGNILQNNGGPSGGGRNIDLNGDGQMPNDDDDLDDGPNGLQNFPIINSATPSDISGTIEAAPSSTFTLDFYAATAQFIGGGAGEAYVGNAQVSTDAAGEGSFSFTPSGSLLPNRFISATLTDAGGSTSEFSDAVQVLGPGSGLVTNTLADGPGSLNDAIEFANQNPGTTISFAIPAGDPNFEAATGTFTIQSQSSPLPAITADSTIIDGSTQTDFNSANGIADRDTAPEIILDGATGAVAGGADGLLIQADNCTVRGLAIGRFSRNGVRIEGGDFNSIFNCSIGVNAFDSGARANGEDGIAIVDGPSPLDGASNNLIGGNGGENIISGNGGSGVLIQSGVGGTGSNSIQGNLIGGIGNGTGTAILALPNAQNGVSIVDSASNIIGTRFSPSNVITGNARDGVSIGGAAAIGNLISGNSIFNNGGLGIDLVTSGQPSNGVSPNDAPGALDADSGPNNAQNFPDISVATFASAGGSISVAGTLSSRANRDYEIEIFSCAPDPSTFGEGETFLDSALVTTNAQGAATFEFTIPAPPLGAITSLCATATDAQTNDTSEFSASRAPIQAALGLSVAPNLISEGAGAGDGAGAATGTVSRNTRTSGALSVQLQSSDITEATVPASVVIPAGATSISFPIRAINDAGADGTQPVVITASSSGFSSASAGLSVADDDSPGVAIAPQSGLETSESGATSTFSVALNTEPDADVLVSLASSDTGEGTVAPSTLRFTPQNFATPQIATVRGVDDAEVDGDKIYSIITTVASNDAAYNRINPPDVSVTNRDNDAGRLSIALATSTLVEGTSTSATVSRTGATTSALVVTITTGAPGLSAPRTVRIEAGQSRSAAFTIAALDDDVDDDVDDTAQNSRAITITASAPNSGLGEGVATIRVQDNDAAAILVTPTSGLITREDGTSDSFSVVLSTRPSSNVSIALSSDLSEGTAAPSTLTFSPQNFATPQVVTVRGVDDSDVDGDQSYLISLAPALSDDAGYRGLDAPDVSVTNRDDDAPALSISPATSTLEEGASATFTLTRPGSTSGALAVSISISDSALASVSPARIAFAPRQRSATFSVVAADDALINGTRAFFLEALAAGFSSARADVSVQDDDRASILVAPTQGLVTSESGTASTFSVRLGARPVSSVQIALMSSDEGEGRVSPSVLIFTPTNFVRPQIVTIRGVDDAVADGAQNFRILLARATSSDAAFRGLDAPDVNVQNRDDDIAALALSIAPASLIEGLSAIATVSRNTASTSEALLVTLSGDRSQVALPARVTIPAGRNSISFAIQARDNSVVDGTRAVSIEARARGLSAASRAISVRDNDVPRLLLSVAPSTLRESGGARAAVATLTRNFNLSSALSIQIFSSNTGAARAPSTISLRAGQASVSFSIAAINNALAQGTRVVILRAVGGGQEARASLQVLDDDSVTVQISPREAEVEVGGSLDFNAVVTGTSDTEVVFNVEEGARGGTISGAGLYTAGQTPGVFHVIATSRADRTRRARATVRVVALALGEPVRSWGANSLGQLGNASTRDSVRAVEVATRAAVAISANGSHSLALGRDGSVQAWGYNGLGQLGDGTRQNRLVPTQVLGGEGQERLSDVSQVAAGWYHSLALGGSGEVWAWGRNLNGQLGLPGTSPSLRPARVPGLPPAKFIAAGVDFSMAVALSGEVWAWGNNARGQLGSGDLSSSSRTPRRVLDQRGQPLAAIVALSLGGAHALALDSSGRAWSWGANDDGQLGLSTNTDLSRARRIETVSLGDSANVAAPLWKDVAAGFAHSLLLARDGRVFSGGNNFYGQLGRAGQVSQSTCRPITSLSSIAAIAAGSGHSVALGTDGVVRAWGWNALGSLGDGTRTSRSEPRPVAGLTNTSTSAISAGYGHTLARGAP